MDEIDMTTTSPWKIPAASATLASATLAFVALPFAGPASAQADAPERAAPPPERADEILLIERSQDRRGRDRLAQVMAKTRIDLRAESSSAKELAGRLAVALGDGWNFAVFAKDPKGDAWPELDLDLRRATVLNVLGIVQSTSELRFVYRGGVVLLKPADEVQELKVLRSYNLAAAVAPLRDRPGPKLGLGGVTEFDIEEVEDSGKTLSGFSLDTLEDLVRRHVEPDSWDDGGATIGRLNNTLLIRQTERGHRKIQRLFAKLGVWYPVRPSVRPTSRARRSPGRR